MKVFITGGTGLIGSAVVSELIGHGHTVTGIARSDASAAALAAAGAESVRGDLTSLEVIRAGATDADGVIHLAFSNDFSSPKALAGAIEEETAALLALADVLVGTDKPLITVSGTPRAEGRPSVESDPIPVEGPVGGRSKTVTTVLEMPGLRASSIRLPRTVHRDGTGGFSGLLTQMARGAGVAGYPGDGSQRWPAVHALDAASLFRIALEQAQAGTAWHAVQDEGDTVLDMVTVIGRRLGVPVQSLPMETFGPLGVIFATDQPASSAYTQATLGWTPIHPNLLTDLELIEP